MDLGGIVRLAKLVADYVGPHVGGAQRCAAVHAVVGLPDADRVSFDSGRAARRVGNRLRVAVDALFHFARKAGQFTHGHFDSRGCCRHAAAHSKQQGDRAAILDTIILQPP